jgi:alpha-tubulin suppressor-like RCC1 family protein
MSRLWAVCLSVWLAAGCGESEAPPSGEEQPAPKTVSVAAGSAHTLALRTDGTVWAMGSNAYGQLGDGTTETRDTPVKVPGLSGIVAIEAAGFHSLALDAEGGVWVWGDNRDGQLGETPPPRR